MSNRLLRFILCDFYTCWVIFFFFIAIVYSFFVMYSITIKWPMSTHFLIFNHMCTVWNLYITNKYNDSLSDHIKFYDFMIVLRSVYLKFDITANCINFIWVFFIVSFLFSWYSDELSQRLVSALHCQALISSNPLIGERYNLLKLFFFFCNFQSYNRIQPNFLIGKQNLCRKIE